MSKSLKQIAAAMGDSHQPKTNLVSDGEVIASTAPIFGDVIITEPTDREPYAPRPSRNGKANGPSTKLVLVDVPMNLVGGHSVSVNGHAVYASLDPETGDLTFEVTVPAKIKIPNKDLRDAYKAHVHEAITAWPRYNWTMGQCYDVLTNPAKPRKAGDKAGADKVRWAPPAKPLAVVVDTAGKTVEAV